MLKRPGLPLVKPLRGPEDQPHPGVRNGRQPAAIRNGNDVIVAHIERGGIDVVFVSVELEKSFLQPGGGEMHGGTRSHRLFLRIGRAGGRHRGVAPAKPHGTHAERRLHDLDRASNKSLPDFGGGAFHRDHTIMQAEHRGGIHRAGLGHTRYSWPRRKRSSHAVCPCGGSARRDRREPWRAEVPHRSGNSGGSGIAWQASMRSATGAGPS